VFLYRREREVRIVRGGLCSCRAGFVPRRLHRVRLFDRRVVSGARFAQRSQRVGARVGDFPHREIARREARLRRARGDYLRGVPRVRRVARGDAQSLALALQPNRLLRL
jgi:hypothetical protein